jgi:putative transcriptional regulator
MNIEQIDIHSLPFLTIQTRNLLPVVSGLYFVTADSENLYIGASSNLRRRWSSHIKLKDLKDFPDVKIAWLEISNLKDLARIEEEAIKLFRPLFNSPKGYCPPSFTKTFDCQISVTLDSFLTKDISLYRLAKDTGVAYSTLWKLNTGRVKSIDFEVLSKLCKYLECSPNDLLSYTK